MVRLLQSRPGSPSKGQSYHMTQHFHSQVGIQGSQKRVHTNVHVNVHSNPIMQTNSANDSKHLEVGPSPGKPPSGRAAG